MQVVRAKHILVQSLNEAVTLKEKIALGEDFSALAKLHSKWTEWWRFGSVWSWTDGKAV